MIKCDFLDHLFRLRDNRGVFNFEKYENKSLDVVWGKYFPNHIEKKFRASYCILSDDWEYEKVSTSLVGGNFLINNNKRYKSYKSISECDDKLVIFRMVDDYYNYKILNKPFVFGTTQTFEEYYEIDSEFDILSIIRKYKDFILYSCLFDNSDNKPYKQMILNQDYSYFEKYNLESIMDFEKLDWETIAKDLRLDMCKQNADKSYIYRFLLALYRKPITHRIVSFYHCGEVNQFRINKNVSMK